MALIPSVDQMAKQILEYKLKPYTDTLEKEEREKFLKEMEDTAVDSLKTKLESVNTSWDALQESLSALGKIPQTIITGITTSATIMPPPAGTTVLVAQLSGDIPVWQAQASDANAKVATIKESLSVLAVGVPPLDPIMASLDSVATTVSNVQSALGAIPI